MKKPSMLRRPNLAPVLSNEESVEQNKARLLYVDDEPGNLLSFRYMLDDAYIIHTAESAKEGWDIIQEESIDLVLSDQRMIHSLS